MHNPRNNRCALCDWGVCDSKGTTGLFLRNILCYHPVFMWVYWKCLKRICPKVPITQPSWTAIVYTLKSTHRKNQRQPFSMLTSSTLLYTIIRSTPTFGVAPGVGGQEMKLNPEKWLAERAARSWTAGIGKRNDLQGKLRSTPRRHCIWTRLEFLFIICRSSSWNLWSWSW